MERTRAIGVEQMTDKKPRCRCKFCGWNYQDTCCCPNPITPNPIQGHTYEFEQGKLAGKKESDDLRKEIIRIHEEAMKECCIGLPDCGGCQEGKKRIEELKSQLSEKRVFSEVFSQKSSKEAKK